MRGRGVHVQRKCCTIRSRMIGLFLYCALPVPRLFAIYKDHHGYWNPYWKKTYEDSNCMKLHLRFIHITEWQSNPIRYLPYSILKSNYATIGSERCIKFFFLFFFIHLSFNRSAWLFRKWAAYCIDILFPALAKRRRSLTRLVRKEQEHPLHYTRSSSQKAHRVSWRHSRRQFCPWKLWEACFVLTGHFVLICGGHVRFWAVTLIIALGKIPNLPHAHIVGSIRDRDPT